MNNLMAVLQTSTYVIIEDTTYFLDFDNRRLLRLRDNDTYEQVNMNYVDGYHATYILEGYDCQLELMVDYFNQSIQLKKECGSLSNFGIESCIA